MKNILLIVILVAVSACCPYRHLTTSTKDSVRVEVRTRTEFVRDTVYRDIPALSEKVTTRDTTSHLENYYAESDACINTDGSLFHSLSTKQRREPIPIDRPVEYRDSIVYRDRAVDRIVQIEKELSWWQKTQIRGFWALLIILVFVLRKDIASLARRLI